MLGDEKLHSKEEIKKEIEEFLNDPTWGKKKNEHLTLTGKKRVLTKWIKQSEWYYNEVLTAFKRPIRARYYLGDFITRIIVENAKRDVEVMKEMRNELDN